MMRLRVFFHSVEFVWLLLFLALVVFWMAIWAVIFS